MQNYQGANRLIMFEILMVAGLAGLCMVHWGYIEKTQGWQNDTFHDLNNPQGHYMMIVIYTILMVAIAF